MKIAYARVSSYGQNLDVQLEKFADYGCDKIFKEKKSWSSTAKRHELEKALDYCREGDIFVVTKLDRLARSSCDLQDILKVLEKKQANFVVLDQDINTTTPTGKLVFSLLWAVAEFEREIGQERRMEGIKSALSRWVKFGRESKLTEQEKEEYSKAVQTGRTRSSVNKEFGISAATGYRVCPGDPERRFLNVH